MATPPRDPARIETAHPVVRFLRRRIARGVPYGLATTLAFAVVALGVWGFVAILDAWTTAGDLARWDDQAHDALYHAFGADRQLGLAVTWFGNNTTLTAGVVLVALALVVAKRYWAAFRVAFASGVGGLVVLGLKSLFSRARPLEQVVEASGYSFPSGHAFGSTVFYGMMIYLAWRLSKRRWVRALAAVVFTTLLVAVGLSRVYLNVHYLTDVVAGWLSGTVWLVASLWVIDLVETRYRSRTEEAEDAGRPDDAGPQAHPRADAAVETVAS